MAKGRRLLITIPIPGRHAAIHVMHYPLDSGRAGGADWEAWLDVALAPRTGWCLATGATREEVWARAVQFLETVTDVLQDTPPDFLLTSLNPIDKLPQQESTNGKDDITQEGGGRGSTG